LGGRLPREISSQRLDLLARKPPRNRPHVGVESLPAGKRVKLGKR
jgi:hypothetical protein